MQIQDQVYGFKLKTDNVDSKSNANISIPAIIYLLNEGQLSLIKKRYGGQNTSYRTAFEETQKRKDEFQRLLVTNESLGITSSSNDDGEDLYNASLTKTKKPYMFLTRTNVIAEKQGCGKRRLKGIIAQTDDLDLILESPLEKPSFEWGETVFRLTQDNLQFISDSTFKVTKAIIDYLRYPAPLEMAGYKTFDTKASVDKHCELPAFMHDDIVDEAVFIYTTSLLNPDMQAKLYKLNNDE